MKSFGSFLVEGCAAQLARVRIARVQGVSSSHPEAHYRSGGLIELFDKFEHWPPAVQRHILFHEFGHWYRDEFVPLADIMGWQDGDNFYNLFGAGNSDEGFAEAFAVCQNPNELKGKYLTQYDAMRGWVSAADVAAVTVRVNQFFATAAS